MNLSGAPKPTSSADSLKSKENGRRAVLCFVLAFNAALLNASCGTVNPHTPEKKYRLEIVSLEEMSEDDLLNAYSRNLQNEHLLIEYAKHPNAPHGVLFMAISSPSPKLRSTVAKREDLPVEFFASLSRDPDITVREAIAANISIPDDILSRMAHDPSSVVREAVIRNPNSNLLILRVLCSDISPFVRGLVVEHPEVSSDLLKILSEDIEVAIRAKVARLPKAPIEILRFLSQDIDPQVRAAVAANRGKLEESVAMNLTNDPDPYVLLSLAVNPLTPDEVLEKLIDIGSPNLIYQMRLSNENVANNPVLLNKLRNAIFQEFERSIGAFDEVDFSEVVADGRYWGELPEYFLERVLHEANHEELDFFSTHVYNMPEGFEDRFKEVMGPRWVEP